MCAKHADVQLFWGDTPENIALHRADLLERAERYGRADKIAFGMRLQVIVRDTEEEAWAFADQLVAGVSESHKRTVATMWEQSQANRRMQGLAHADDQRIGEHLWTGITTVRPGAGVAVVGDPRQVADTLAQFVDAGCTEFCLSGYPHDEEATRFGRLVMPVLADQPAGTSA